jgi:hypothetical protein
MNHVQQILIFLLNPLNCFLFRSIFFRYSVKKQFPVRHRILCERKGVSTNLAKEIECITVAQIADFDNRLCRRFVPSPPSKSY